MKDYIYWSLRQLYLLGFWPSRFEREVERIATSHLRLRPRERFRYVLRMLPWIFALASFGNILVGYACEAIGIGFDWRHSWLGVLAGMVLAVASGIAVRVALGVAGGIALGVALGVHLGALGGVSTGIALTVALRLSGTAATIALVSGIVTSVISGLVFGGASGFIIGSSSGVADETGGGTVSAFLVALAVGIELSVLFEAIAGLVGGLSALLGFVLVYLRIVTYPLDAALSFITYVAATWRPETIRYVWRWCPVVWSEAIWLPLPFVGRLLALLVQADRDEGFTQITFISAKRRTQRSAAVYALTELAITDLQARPLSEIADVTEKLAWMTDTPAALSAELTAALRRFDKAAHYVGQYLSLHSAYRRAEALNNAISELRALQRNLITSREHFARRLLQAVNQWDRVLNAERTSTSSQAEIAREIPNPFVFGNPVAQTNHNVFTGRHEIVRQIEASLLGATQPPMLLLQGSRRMGKTSILNQLPRLLGPDIAPAVLDCQNPAVTERPATLLRSFSRALVDGLRRRHVEVESLSSADLLLQPFARFDDWLKNLERAMPERMKVLLCLDEYERLQAGLDAGWGEALLDGLRHILQHRPRLALMFSGTHTFRQLGPLWTDRFIGAKRVRVSFLTRDEMLPLLTAPIPEFDLTYDPDLLDVIFAATNGQPFLTQAVAFELVQFLNEEHRKHANISDVENAIARALESGGEYFANIWSDSGEEGQAILYAIANGLPAPEFSAARTWLRENDVLDPAGKFAVLMFQRWVEMRI